MYQSHRPREEKSKAEYNKGQIGVEEESIKNTCDEIQRAASASHSPS